MWRLSKQAAVGNLGNVGGDDSAQDVWLARVRGVSQARVPEPLTGFALR